MREMGFAALVRTFLTLVAAGPAIWVLGVRRAMALTLGQSAPWRLSTGEPDLAEMQTVRRLRAVMRALPWRPSCLTASVALLHLLRAEGIAAELRLGVNRDDGPFRAHAWVERDGRVLFDTSSEFFSAFPAALSNRSE